jgi:light-regulated signal transduction histidine kinase (bacteriophytochrome)
LEAIGCHYIRLTGTGVHGIQASGLLATRMTLGHFIFLFRSELVRTIRWGGKPEKIVDVDKDGCKFFGPRRSFALYLDKVLTLIRFAGVTYFAPILPQ